MQLRPPSSTITFSLVSCAQNVWTPNKNARQTAPVDARRLSHESVVISCLPNVDPEEPKQKLHLLGGAGSDGSWPQRNFPGTTSVSLLDRDWFQVRRRSEKENYHERYHRPGGSSDAARNAHGCTSDVHLLPRAQAAYRRTPGRDPARSSRTHGAGSLRSRAFTPLGHPAGGGRRWLHDHLHVNCKGRARWLDRSLFRRDSPDSGLRLFPRFDADPPGRPRVIRSKDPRRSERV